MYKISPMYVQSVNNVYVQRFKGKEKFRKKNYINIALALNWDYLQIIKNNKILS